MLYIALRAAIFGWILERQIDIDLLAGFGREDLDHGVVVHPDLCHVNLLLVQVLQPPEEILLHLDPLHHCILNPATLEQKLELALSELFNTVQHVLPLLRLEDHLVDELGLLRKNVLSLALNRLLLLLHLDEISLESLAIKYD